MKPLVVLAGPTAVGKSEIGVRVAQALDTEVLTADSRQVYRGMDIGTDKPSLDQRRGIPHQLIDLVDPDKPFNVGEYRRLALAEIDRLYRKRKLPLVVGGTGLYVRALVRGLCDAPQADPAFRVALVRNARLQGPTFLHRELARIDPALACRLHPNDEPKLVRALEVHHLSGRRLSAVHQAHSFGDGTFVPLLVGLTRERASLYRRIEARIDAQLSQGFVGEVKRLVASGYGRESGAMKGLGYRQIAQHLAGECGYEEAVGRFKRDTRRFAKRQLTWFTKEPNVAWVSIAEEESSEQVANRILQLVEVFLGTLPALAEQTYLTMAPMPRHSVGTCHE